MAGNNYDQGLHSSEGGVREEHLRGGPWSYARELARYIACPTTVRVRVIEQFGHAPSLSYIGECQAVHQRQRDSFSRQSERLRCVADGSRRTSQLSSIYGQEFDDRCADMRIGSEKLLAAIERETAR